MCEHATDCEESKGPYAMNYNYLFTGLISLLLLGYLLYALLKPEQF